MRIEVEDTGIGIPEDAQERIFERFTQVDEAVTRRYGGTGLGLSIARQLAGMMGGTLTVRSEPGAGACFTLRVAFARLPEAERSLQGRVVLVGPRHVTAGYCRRMAAWGVEASPVTDPARACEALERTQRPRVVLAIGADRQDAASCGAILADRFADEPLDLILVGAGEHGGVPPCLAVLPADVGDEQLFNALHAALTLPETPADEALTAPWRGGAGRRVLVAEDNRTNQRVIERMLRSVGHEVTIVDNGEQALNALENGAFDLVLMDLNMPVMGGLDAIRLHRFAASGERMPRFVALTADASDETRRQSAEAGIDAYVTKPVEVRELLSLVDRLTRSGPAPAPVARAQDERRGGAAPAHGRRAAGARPRLPRAPAAAGRRGRLRRRVIADFLEDGDQLVRQIAQAAAASAMPAPFGTAPTPCAAARLTSAPPRSSSCAWPGGASRRRSWPSTARATRRGSNQRSSSCARPFTSSLPSTPAARRRSPDRTDRHGLLGAGLLGTGPLVATLLGAHQVLHPPEVGVVEPQRPLDP